ncbi:MAG: antitoxin, partial [Candidatus Electrothrix sp. AR1]|nr:antitoxin [Candidatus Electrothrix sp. AR1]
MRSLSIQGIDERLAVQLRQQAKKARKSLNQFVLDTLKKHVG